MADYISREAAFESLSEYYHHRLEIQHIALREALNRVPAADVVEVVRCKDCAKYDPDAEWCNVWQCYLQPDFFCACGKRRVDNG